MTDPTTPPLAYLADRAFVLRADGLDPLGAYRERFSLPRRASVCIIMQIQGRGR